MILMVGVEIDMVVPDSLEALRLYEKVFNAERIEVTAYEKGTNEAVFNMYKDQSKLGKFATYYNNLLEFCKNRPNKTDLYEKLIEFIHPR
jgi:hypothetical protein